MRTIKYLACMVSILALAFHAQGEIASVKSLEEAQKIIENAYEKDLLVAFDVDMTITQPNHPAAFYPALVKYKEIYKSIVASLTPEQRDVMSALTLDLPQILVEENAPDVIASLSKKYQTIAFTAVLANKDIVTSRIKTLNSLGINFTPDIEDMNFTNIKPYQGQSPIFTRGILFGNGEAYGKGIVFCAFLKQLKRLPKMAVVIDDRKKNLEDIERALLEQKIDLEFLGLEYKGAFARSGDVTEKEFKAFWHNIANKAKHQTCYAVELATPSTVGLSPTRSMRLPWRTRALRQLCLRHNCQAFKDGEV